MLLRELVNGDPPHVCKVIYLDAPGGFGHRVMDGARVLEHVVTKLTDFEQAVAEKIAEGYVESECSLTRRVFTKSDLFWIISLDGETLRTQTGGIRADWRESSGQSRSKEFRHRDRAVAAYFKAIADKVAEGFHEKYGREIQFDDRAKSPRKPSRRKSR